MPVRLTDLLPAVKRAEIVEVLGKPVECRPLQLGEIAELMLRFRGALRLTRDGDGTATGRNDQGAGASSAASVVTVRIDQDALASAGPAAIAAVLAAGTGAAGDAEEEAAAAALPPGVQARLFAAILRLSAPEGVIPFVTDLVGLVGAQISPEDQARINGLANAA